MDKTDDRRCAVIIESSFNEYRQSLRKEVISKSRPISHAQRELELQRWIGYPKPPLHSNHGRKHWGSRLSIINTKDMRLLSSIEFEVNEAVLLYVFGFL